jgi:hypothetical protein
MGSGGWEGKGTGEVAECRTARDVRSLPRGRTVILVAEMPSIFDRSVDPALLGFVRI